VAPYGEDLWGALASKGGVIVTVEKDRIKPSTSGITRPLVKIPSYRSMQWRLAAFGLHPFSLAIPA